MSDQEHRQQVAGRIREIAEKFGGITAFAEKIGLPQPQLSQYTTGRRLPGNKFRERLRSVGVDDFYIMYGSKEESDKRFAVSVMDLFRNSHPEKAKMLDTLEKASVTTSEQLKLILSLFKNAATAAAQVNESKAEYKAKGRKK